MSAARVGTAGTCTPRSTTGRTRGRWAAATCRSGAGWRGAPAATCSSSDAGPDGYRCRSRRAGVRLVGIDRSTAMLERAPKRASPTLPAGRRPSRRHLFAATSDRCRSGRSSLPWSSRRTASCSRCCAIGTSRRRSARCARPAAWRNLRARPGSRRAELARVPEPCPARRRPRRRHLTLIESVRQQRRRHLTVFEQCYVERRGDRRPSTVSSYSSVPSRCGR